MPTRRRPFNRSGRIMTRAIPIVAIGGVALYLASKVVDLDLNVGWKDPEESVTDSIGDGVQQDIREVQTAIGSSVTPTEDDSEPLVKPENRYVGGDVVDVLIDRDRYLLQVKPAAEATLVNGVPRQSVAVQEVIRLTRELPGEESGIKIRIRRTAEATAAAEKELLAELHNADIPDDQIDSRMELVE